MDKIARLRELREGKIIQAVTVEPEEKLTPSKGLKRQPGKADPDLDVWFGDRRKELTGFCQCGCGERSSKGDDKNFKASICHIYPKRHFKSVKCHPLNYIEMAFWGGCHTNMDNQGYDRWPNMACWEVIKIRIIAIFPAVSPKEYKHLPDLFITVLTEAGITINYK